MVFFEDAKSTLAKVRRLQMSETIAVHEFLYELAAHLGATTDFGIDLDSVTSGRIPIPSQGVRGDTVFVGEVTGQKLKGKLTGIDYWTLRADGVGVVNAYGVLTTLEGERIAYHAAGFFTGEAGSPIYRIREDFSLYTGSSKYLWINTILGWQTGILDMSRETVVMKSYAA
jgi:hypothetical protein